MIAPPICRVDPIGMPILLEVFVTRIVGGLVGDPHLVLTLRQIVLDEYHTADTALQIPGGGVGIVGIMGGIGDLINGHDDVRRVVMLVLGAQENDTQPVLSCVPILI